MEWEGLRYENVHKQWQGVTSWHESLALHTATMLHSCNGINGKEMQHIKEQYIKNHSQSRSFY